MRGSLRFFPGRRRQGEGARTRRACTRRARRRDERGISILEVVIAFVILMVVLVPIAQLLGNVIGQAANARERLTALSLAEQWIEILNNSGPPLASDGLPITNSYLLEKARTVRSTVAYAVHARFTWTTSQGTKDLCTAVTVPKLLTLQVTVTWSRTQTITDTTVINYPPPGLPTDGFLAVRVDGDPSTNPPTDAGGNAWKTRVVSVPVTISSTTATFPTTTIFPNQYGCAFEEVPPGTFTLAVAGPTPGTPAGTQFGPPTTLAWVTTAEALTKSVSTLVVTVGTITPATVTFDEGSLVTLAYPDTTAVDAGVICPGGGALLCVALGQAPHTASAPASAPRAEVSVLTTSGWSVTRPTGASRLAAAACAGAVRCIAVGFLQTGGTYRGAAISAAPATPPVFSTSTVPATVQALDQIACPAANQCYAAGSTTTGAVAILSGAVNAAGVTWTSDTVPAGLTSLSALTCPGPTTCFALGAGSASASILSLKGTTWSADPVATTTLTSARAIACPTAALCYAVGTTASAPALVSLSTATATPPKWAADTVPTAPAPTALTTVTCPGAATCYVIGAAGANPLVLSLAAPTTWTADTLPALPANAALASITCPTAAACVVTENSSAGVGILSLTKPTTWKLDTLPAGLTVDGISALACPSAAHCFAAGVGTSGSGARAVILSLSGSASWTLDTFAGGVVPAYLTGLACTGTTCAAAGATTSAAVLLTASATATTWANVTPSSASGMYIADTPISINDVTLVGGPTVEYAAPAANLAQIGPLFPFPSGYLVAATACKTGVTATAPVVHTFPGSTTSATLDLGILPIQVRTPSGAPVANATVTAAPTCSELTPLSGPANPASYALETTGALGLSQTALPYGSYKVTVKSGTHSASLTVSVQASSITVGATTIDFLPTPVPVTVT